MPFIFFDYLFLVSWQVPLYTIAAMVCTLSNRADAVTFERGFIIYNLFTMATASFNDIIVQVHSITSSIDESFRYYVRWFDQQKPLKELTFKYFDGNFIVIKGDASEREKDMLTHCIQALELSNAFVR